MRGMFRLERWCLAARWAVRRRWLNATPGIDVSKHAIVAPSARFALQPDGWRLRGSIRVAAHCRIATGAMLAPFGGRIELAEGVYVGPYCVLNGHGGLRIGRKTLIAAHTVIIPANHGFDDTAVPIADQPESRLGIEIGDDVWIGCGVRILDGVTIGDGAVIGAGAVVTRSIPPWSIAIGVPARVIRNRGANEDAREALVSSL